MCIIMDVCSGEIEISGEETKEESYNSEVMCTGWNPAVEAMRVEQMKVITKKNSKNSMPVDLTTEDIDAFLSRVYESQG